MPFGKSLILIIVLTCFVIYLFWKHVQQERELQRIRQEQTQQLRDPDVIHIIEQFLRRRNAWTYSLMSQFVQSQIEMQTNKIEPPEEDVEETETETETAEATDTTEQEEQKPLEKVAEEEKYSDDQ